MKQQIKRICGAVCVGAILVSSMACGIVEVDEGRDNARIAATVEDIQITKGEWKQLYTQYASQYGITEEIEKDPQYKEAITELKQSILEVLVLDKVGLLEMKASGMELTDEEKAEIEKNADDYIESQRELARGDWEEKAKTDASIDVEKEVEEDVNEWLSLNDLSREKIIETYTEDTLMQQFMEKMLDGVVATDEEIKTAYDSQVETQKEEFATAGTCDYYEAMGQLIVYRPAGFVRVKHILIQLDEDTRSQISTLRGENNTSQADQVRDEGLKKLQAEADEVLAKVKAGEDFEALIDQYNDDPGMKNSPTKETGYTLGANSYYRQEFIDASLALQEVNDTSDLVVTDEGYHIIKLMEKVPEGAVDFATVKEAIAKTADDSAKSLKWQEYLDEWKPKYKISYHYNVL